MVFLNIKESFTKTVRSNVSSSTRDTLEVEEAFNNWIGKPLIDDRKQHRTNPPTIWFCAETTEGRILKIIGIPLVETREFVLKSAYEASDWEINFYEENN